jgi:hypothetical protein
MAKPRILVSSTCSDLYLIREQLRGLIDSFGYEPVLSEDGDIYYSPDLHVHLSCIREIRNCDLVILLVGNRFGTPFIEAPTRSITQAEHDAAFFASLPIFAFIDEKVLHDHIIYRNVIEKHRGDEKEQNRILSGIPFASQTDLRVFTFIDDISRKVVNNSYFPFKNFQDIESSLKKQWAGMLFDFLSERKQRKSNEKIINLLSHIEIANEKVEQIVALLAAKTMSQEDQKNILTIENTANEKRLTFIMLQVWQSFNLNADAANKAKEIHKDKIVIIRELLLDKEINSKTMIALTKLLQELGITRKDTFYVHYLVEVRINELRVICKKHSVSNHLIEQAIRDSLLQLPKIERPLKQKKTKAKPTK